MSSLLLLNRYVEEVVDGVTVLSGKRKKSGLLMSMIICRT